MARAADFASARIDGLIARSFFAFRRFALDRAEKRKWVAYAENSCEQRRLQVAFGLWRATVAQRNLAARQNAADITANGVFPQGSLDASLLPRSLLPPAQPFVGLPAAKEASELGGLDDRPFRQAQRGSPGLMEPSTMTAAPSPSAWQSESLLKLGREIASLSSSFANIGPAP